MGLRSDSQDIVADALNQRRFPARGDGAERVPGVARNKAELRGLRAELLLDMSISLRRWLVVLHTISTESAFKQIDDAAVLELAGLHLKQIVPEPEQPETPLSHPAPPPPTLS